MGGIGRKGRMESTFQPLRPLRPFQPLLPYFLSSVLPTFRLSKFNIALKTRK